MDRCPCGQGDNVCQYGLPHENRRLLVSLLASPSHPSLSNEEHTRDGHIIAGIGYSLGRRITEYTKYEA